MSYSNDELIKMYQTMVMSRTYDDMIYDTAMDGDIIGMHHLARGEEAVGAAVITGVRDTDWIVPTHRMHTVQLGRFDYKKFAAEQFGMVTGVCQGMSCDFHVSDPAAHMLYSNGILGQNVPIAAGFAYALKLDKKDEIVVACEGDGAFQEGINYEALNMATIFELPLLIIVDDNQYSYSFPSNRYKKNMSERAAAYGLHAVTVDGCDMLAVREAVDTALVRVRKNEPCLIECKTMRWDGHHTGDDQTSYRDVSNIADAKENNDPIKKFERILFDQGILTEEKKKEIWSTYRKMANEAKEYAMGCDYPTAEVVLDPHKIYSQPWEVEL